MQTNTATTPNLTAANLRNMRRDACMTFEMVAHKIPELTINALSRIERGSDPVPESLGVRLIELYSSASSSDAKRKRALFLSGRIASDSTELQALLSTPNQDQQPNSQSTNS